MYVISPEMKIENLSDPMLFPFGLSKNEFMVCSTLKWELIPCGLDMPRWEFFPFSSIKLFMTSGFWLLMDLNETFCRANLYFRKRSTWSFRRKFSFPILVSCGSLQCSLPISYLPITWKVSNLLQKKPRHFHNLQLLTLLLWIRSFLLPSFSLWF